MFVGAFIHNSHELGTTQIVINKERVNKLCVTSAMEEH